MQILKSRFCADYFFQFCLDTLTLDNAGPRLREIL